LKIQYIEQTTLGNQAESPIWKSYQTL